MGEAVEYDLEVGHAKKSVYYASTSELELESRVVRFCSRDRSGCIHCMHPPDVKSESEVHIRSR